MCETESLRLAAEVVDRFSKPLSEIRHRLRPGSQSLALFFTRLASLASTTS
jgi:hypothetical protein